MFCQKCGREHDESAAFCSGCGAALIITPVEEAPKPKKKKSFGAFLKKWRVLICIVLVLGLLAGAGAVVFTMLSPEYIAKQYVEARIFDDLAKMRKYAMIDPCAEVLYTSNNPGFGVPKTMDEEDYFEYKSVSLGEDINSWEDLSKLYRESCKEEYEDLFGQYKLTLEVTGCEDVSIRTFKQEWQGRLESLEKKNGDFDVDDIDNIKEMTIKIRFDGEDEDDTITATVVMVKVGGRWRAFDSRGVYIPDRFTGK